MIPDLEISRRCRLAQGADLTQCNLSECKGPFVLVVGHAHLVSNRPWEILGRTATAPTVAIPGCKLRDSGEGPVNDSACQDNPDVKIRLPCLQKFGAAKLSPAPDAAERREGARRRHRPLAVEPAAERDVNVHHQSAQPGRADAAVARADANVADGDDLRDARDATDGVLPATRPERLARPVRPASYP